MGQLAFLKMFMLVSIPTDIYDNRRHIHIFRKGGRHLKSVAKIWIEKEDAKFIEVAESELSAKDLNMVIEAIDKNWSFINEQITKVFKGEKIKIKNIEE